MKGAFIYLMEHKIVREEQYPYTSGKGVTGTCDKKLAAGGKVEVESYQNVPYDNPE